MLFQGFIILHSNSIFGSLWWGWSPTILYRHKLSCAYNPYKVKQLRWFWQFWDFRICGGLIKNKNDISTSTNSNEECDIHTCYLWSSGDFFVVKVKRWLLIALFHKCTFYSWICTETLESNIRLNSWHYMDSL